MVTYHASILRIVVVSGVLIGLLASGGITAVQAEPALTNPAPGSTLGGSTVTFDWTAGGSTVTKWWLYIGTGVNGKDIYDSGSLGTATTDTVSGLPTDGSTVFVRLWDRIAGSWSSRDYTYTAFTSGGGGGGGGGEGNHTLRWDQALPAAERFVLVLGGAAVLDLETGLVWEQSPPTTTHTWAAARTQCPFRTVGDKRGWRLPSLHELASLVDPNNTNPALPTGHPFSNIQSTAYWSVTSFGDELAVLVIAWNVNFGTGDAGAFGKTNGILVWCVRGGQGHGVVY